MFNTKEIVKSKKFPQFIKTSPVIKSNNDVNKVFPKLGLKNASKSVKIDVDNYSIINLLGNYIDDWDDYDYDAGSFLTAKKASTQYLIQQIRNAFPNKKQRHENKIIKLQKSIKNIDGKVIYKKGSNILTILSKLNSDLKKSKANTILGLDGILNVASSKAKLKVVFSSDGLNGLWDIATMSMRGIKSCQRWYGSHAGALIGTLVDPYAGIIYITDGTKTKHGPKMLARSVVRVVIDSKDNKPYLYIEQIYVANDSDDDDDYDDNHSDSNCYVNAFKEYLEKKINKKMPVLYGYRSRSSKLLYIPNSEAVGRLSESQKSYRDSGLQYQEASNAAKLKSKFIQ